MQVLLVLIGLISLLATQRILNKQFSFLVHRLGGGHNSVIWFWSFIFLPGTIIHEISHFIVAAMTGSRTGKIEIFPEFIDDELNPGERKSVKLGSVQVARMNPIQGFLVGLAPFITGSILLVWLSTFLDPSFQNKEYLKFSLLLYLFFTIGNSFFPSREDLKHTLPFIVLIALSLIGAWYLGFNFSFEPGAKLAEIMKVLANSFFVSIGINGLIIVFLFSTNRLLKHQIRE